MKQVIKPLRNSYEGVLIFLVYRPRTYVSENNFLDWVRPVWVLLMCTYGNKPSAIITTDKNDLKVNKPVYIAKLRQRYYKILNNILLHAPNHALKDAQLRNYKKYEQFVLYTLTFLLLMLFYYIMSSKQLGFLHIPYPF